MLQAHDSAGGIGSALGSLAGKAVAAAQGTTAAVKDKVPPAHPDCTVLCCSLVVA